MALHVPVGRKEMGKTTLGYYMTAKAPKRVIFDPRRRIRRGGIMVTQGSHVDDAFVQLQERPGREVEIVYSPSENDIGAAFDLFASRVKDWIQTYGEVDELVVMVDEMAIAEVDRSPAFEWCVKCCESDRVHFVLTGHRTMDVPISIRTLVNHWYFFQTSEKRDLGIIEDIGGDPLADRVRTLQLRQFAHYDVGRQATLLHLNPSAWYVPLRLDHPPTPTVQALDTYVEGGVPSQPMVDLPPLFR
jgi:hypothetical protein